MSRVDGATGVVTPLAKVDAFKVVVARNGVVYGATGGPSGGRVVRISPSGRVVPVAGTGRLGPHRDGRALAAPMLPSAIALAPDGALLVAQIEPVPAIRRVDLALADDFHARPRALTSVATRLGRGQVVRSGVCEPSSTMTQPSNSSKR